MSEYRRPPIQPLVFFDEDGQVINYGSRWEGSPPEDSYSVTDHPERFQPVQTIADALIEYLTDVYEVEVTEGEAAQQALVPHEFYVPDPEQTTRVVGLTPGDRDCSPVTFIYTNYPSVQVLAGAFASFGYPSCGCDACDETWESCADEMEGDVFAIVNGGFEECVKLSRRRRVSYQRGVGLEVGMGRAYGWSLTTRDSKKGSQSDANNVPRTTLEAIHRRLEALAQSTPNGAWKAWPKRGN